MAEKDVIVIYAQSAESAAAQMKEQNIPAGSVRRLSFLDHGRGPVPFAHTTEQTLGQNALTVDNVKLFESYLTRNAYITFYGCFVGCNRTFLNEVSAAMGGRATSAPNLNFTPSAMQWRDRYGRIYREEWKPLPTPIGNSGFNKNK